jgi:carbon monoxide dehydrogenase subunit G
MIIEGNFTIQAPIERVWDFLIDIEGLSLCLPGVEQVEKNDATTYSGVVRVKVGPMSSAFQGSVNLVAIEPPTHLKARLQGKDRNTASLVSGEFSSHLLGRPGGVTEVQYKFDLAIRGRLGQFGQAVILDTARQLTDEFVTCIRARLEQDNTAPQPVSPRTNLGIMVVRALFSQVKSSLSGLWDRVRKPGRQ